jgi:transposase
VAGNATHSARRWGRSLAWTSLIQSSRRLPLRVVIISAKVLTYLAVAARCALGALEAELDRFDKMIHKQLREDRGYRLIQRIDGVGPVLAAVFVAELGDVFRFVDATRVCSWTGLTRRHRESDTTVHRGSITNQGSRLMRWAAIEAVQHTPARGMSRSGSRFARDRRSV